MFPGKHREIKTWTSRKNDKEMCRMERDGPA